MQKKITRTKGNRFCTLEVELSDHNGKGLELSICGTAGRIQSRAQTKRDALDCWISFFEDQPAEIMEMNKRFNKRFISARSAARFVIATDGEFHGMDVVKEDGNNTFICDSCGQIREEIAEFFPEAKPYFEYHLNGMHAGCQHQRKLGWGNGRDVALAAADCTTVQLEVLNAELAAKVAKLRKEWIEKSLGLDAIVLLKKAGLEPTIFNVEALHAYIGSNGKVPFHMHDSAGMQKVGNIVMTLLESEAARAVPDQKFSSQIFKGSIGAPCPECGYRYGVAWLYEPLPQHVIDWVNSL